MVTIVVRLADLEFLSPHDLSGEISAAEIIDVIRSLMHAGFKRLAPEDDTGMDLDAPSLTALELFNAKKEQD